MKGKFGVHALVFGDAWTEATARATCRTAAEIGYDLVEVLMFDPWTLDLGATKSGRGSAWRSAPAPTSPPMIPT